MNGVKPDVINLGVFPFSLRDLASNWFESSRIRSIGSGEQLVEAFLDKLFPLLWPQQEGGRSYLSYREEMNLCS